MKVLIIGATGETGRHLIESCLNKNYEVSVLARRPSKLSAYNTITVFKGDVLDFDTVQKSVKGQSAVLCALGATRGEKVGETRSAGTKNIVKAMIAERVPRHVAVSTIGVGTSRDNMSALSRFLYPLIIGKERLHEAELQESLIMASELDWTILRPPRLLSSCDNSNVTVDANVATIFKDALERKSLADFMAVSASLQSTICKALTIVGR